MSKLEDLVPPLDLCRKIPVGKFEDSALVLIFWHKSPNTPVEIRTRCEVENDPEFDDLVEEQRIIIYPAPTLEEILAELPKFDMNEIPLACVPEFGGERRIFGGAWAVGYTDKNNATDKSAATAALKLWLELNKEGEQ